MMQSTSIFTYSDDDKAFEALFMTCTTRQMGK